MFGKLTSTAIEVREGVSYEQKTYNNNGAISVIERVVTKQSYTAPLASATAQVALLTSLQENCAA